MYAGRSVYGTKIIETVFARMRCTLNHTAHYFFSPKLKVFEDAAVPKPNALGVVVGAFPNVDCTLPLVVPLVADPKGELAPKEKVGALVDAGAAAAVGAELPPNEKEDFGASAGLSDVEFVLAPLPNDIGLFEAAAPNALPELVPLAKPPNPDFGVVAKVDEAALLDPNALDAPEVPEVPNALEPVPGRLKTNFGADVASAVSAGLGAGAALPKLKLGTCGLAASGAGVELAAGALVTPKLNLGGAGLAACVLLAPNAVGVEDVAEEPNADVEGAEPNAGVAAVAGAVDPTEEPNAETG